MSESAGAVARNRESKTSSLRCVLLVTLVAVLIRVWCLGSFPLIITNDGVRYLDWGVQLAAGESLSVIPSYRTPAYPIFLAAVFEVFGVGSVGVLMAQHLLGCLTCALITLAACRVVGPRWGWLPGLLYAFDPWLLAIESFALTETLSIACVALAAAIVLGECRPRWLFALLLGIALGCACLVRPALQVVVPFFALAWLLKSYGAWKPAVGGLVLGAAGVALPLGPWMYFNSQREVPGVASGYSMMQFRGLFRFGLLDRDFPVDAEVRQEIARFDGRTLRWRDARTVAERIGGWQRAEDLFPQWTRASIRKNPGAYLRHCYYALCWQLNYFPSRGPDPDFDWLNASIRRLSHDGNNVWYRGNSEKLGVAAFTMKGAGGPLRGLFAWIGARIVGGVPQVPIFLLAALGMLLGLLRRDWCLMLLFGGTLAYALAHVLTLFPVGRYLMPMWPIWYVSVVVTPMQFGNLLKRFASRRPRDPKISTSPLPDIPSTPAPRNDAAPAPEPTPDQGHNSDG